MRNYRVPWVLIALGLTLLPITASAQSASTGAIAGGVRDATGAVLPGVTVEARSDALIEGVRVATTDRQGLYKIVELRPGTYTVTFTLAGFRTVRREGIGLTTGFTAEVDAELSVGALEETVVVTGASPTVDLQNVHTQNVLARATLDALPTNKTIQGFATLTPGAVLPSGMEDVGGNKAERYGAIQMHGVGIDQGKQTWDGIPLNKSLSSGGGANRDYLINQVAVQEVVVQTSGVSAEAETGGIVLNFIPKEGGNTFSFYSNIDFSNKHLQADNVSPDQFAGGVRSGKTKHVYDAGVGLGGPIIKDKLWFYTAHRWWGSEELVAGNFYNKQPESWFYEPDFNRPAFSDFDFRDNQLRLTWQLAEKHKIMLSESYEMNCQCNFLVPPGTRSPEADIDFVKRANLALASWTYTVNDRLLLQASGAYVFTANDSLGAEGETDRIGVVDVSNNYMYRAAVLYGPGNYGHFNDSQYNSRFSVSYITGSHSFKTGLTQLGGGVRYWDQRINGDVSYLFRVGTPIALTQYATPAMSNQRLKRNLGVYAQDQWTIRRLTLNLGVRWDHLNSYVPAQRRNAGQFVPAIDVAEIPDVPNWTDVSPRLGAAYDLFGNGKTALKVFVGRYVNSHAVSIAQEVNPANAIVTSGTRTWVDLDRDYTPDCDLHSLAANGECGRLSAPLGSPLVRRRYSQDLLEGFGVRPYHWQSSVSVQRELMPGVSLNVGWFRTSHGNFTVADNLEVTPADYDPYCITAPVDSRLPGGGGYPVCNLYDLTPSKLGRINFLVRPASDFGKQIEVFNGVDATVAARFGGGVLLTGGVSTGRQVTDTCDVVPDSPVQYCRVEQPWSYGTQVKLAGAYSLPWHLQVAATYQNLPGVAINPDYAATNAEIAPSLGRNLALGSAGIAIMGIVKPYTMFLDRRNQVDLRAAKIFEFGRAQVRVAFDFYNLLNANSETIVFQRYGPAWLKPTAILGGRMFKFGSLIEF